LDKNIDLRISRTYKLIKEAFLELMEIQGFDKITVKDLTNKAMISRTTFYLHYKDKFDLLEQIENEILDGFKSILDEVCIDEIITKDFSIEKYSTLLIRIYEYIKENQQFFKLIMGKNGDPSFYYKLNETMKLTVDKNILIDRLKIPEHYAIAFIIGFQTSIINEWINTGMKETPYEIASIVTQVMNNVPKNIYKF
jgi:AcrR family transcriptional regulator